MLGTDSLKERLMNPDYLLLGCTPPKFHEFCRELKNEIERIVQEEVQEEIDEIYWTDYESDPEAQEVYKKIADAGIVPFDEAVTEEELGYIDYKLKRWRERFLFLREAKMLEEESRIIRDFDYFYELSTRVLECLIGQQSQLRGKYSPTFLREVHWRLKSISPQFSLGPL